MTTLDGSRSPERPQVLIARLREAAWMNRHDPDAVQPPEYTPAEINGLCDLLDEAAEALAALPPAQGETDLTIDQILSHWFTQGGTARYGALTFDGRDPWNADEVVSAILALIEKREAPPAAQGEPPAEPQDVDVQLLAWAVSNCHMLARRRLNALRQRIPLSALLQTEMETWEHVQRICEKAGARSKGVLRASLPTEMTEGAATPSPAVAPAQEHSKP